MEASYDEERPPQNDRGESSSMQKRVRQGKKSKRSAAVMLEENESDGEWDGSDEEITSREITDEESEQDGWNRDGTSEKMVDDQ